MPPNNRVQYLRNIPRRILHVIRRFLIWPIRSCWPSSTSRESSASPTETDSAPITRLTRINLENISYILEQMNEQDLRNRQYHCKFLRNFSNPQVLGGGSFGVVYAVERPNHCGNSFDSFDFESGDSYGFQHKFAIKLIPNFDPVNSFIEINALSMLIHPNIVKCHNVWDEVPDQDDCPPEEWTYLESLIPQECSGVLSGHSSLPSARIRRPGFMNKCLFLKYDICTGGTIESLLKYRDENGQISYDCYPETQDIFIQILEGLLYLEFNKVVHGDFKPNNIFLEKDGDYNRVKIGDFGLSKTPLAVGTLTVDCDHDTVNDDIDPFYVGRIYTAPEHVKKVFTHKGDMYCLGLIFIAMLAPVQNNDERRSIVLDAMDPDHRRKYPEWLPINFNLEFQWIKRLISYRLSDRPSASELKNLMQNYKSSIRNEKINFDKIANCYLQFAEKLMEQKVDIVDSYRFLSEIFYKVLPILEVDKTDEIVFQISGLLSTDGQILGNWDENCYRGLVFVSHLECVLGFDDLRTLECQIKLYRNLNHYLFNSDLKATSKPEGIWDIFDKLSEKIENSSLYIGLSETHILKMDHETNYCNAVYFNSKSTQETLQIALEKFEKVMDITMQLLETGVKEFIIAAEISIKSVLHAGILSRLGRKEEADYIYFELIDGFCANPLIGISKLVTLQPIYLYVEFLNGECNFVKARTYCEALCYQFTKMDQSEVNYQNILALKQLAKIYYELGFQRQVDLVLEYFLVPAEIQCAVQNVGKNISLGCTNSDGIDVVKIVRKAFNLYGGDDASSGLVQSTENYLQGDTDYGPLFKECHPSIVESALEYRKNMESVDSAAEIVNYFKILSSFIQI